jgi:hypothetical protein
MRAKMVNSLNEMSLDSIDYNDIITDELIDGIVEQLSGEDEDEQSEYLRDAMRHELLEKWEDIIYLFNYKLINENDEISIYRKMTVDTNWLKHLESQGKRLGIYWSWDVKAAEPHWGYDTKPQTIMIESSIKSTYVNWPETLTLNINPLYEEEKEIRLYKNTLLKIKNIYDNENNLLPIPIKIKEKIFKA